MSKIKISLVAEDADVYTFDVEVSGDNSATSHKVTLKESDYKTMTNGKVTPETLVKKSFGFLLAREPKESILRQFNLMEISRYFPEYIETVKNF